MSDTAKMRQLSAEATLQGFEAMLNASHRRDSNPQSCGPVLWHFRTNGRGLRILRKHYRNKTSGLPIGFASGAPIECSLDVDEPWAAARIEAVFIDHKTGHQTSSTCYPARISDIAAARF